MLDNEEILPLLDKYNGLSYRTGPGFNETQLELHSLTSKLRRRLYSIAVIHCMSSLAFGYNLVIVSPALSFIANAFGLATISEEVVVSSLFVGCLLGSTCCGPISNKIGRSKFLLINNFFLLIGEILEFCAPRLEQLVLGRVLVGIGIGSAAVIVPLFLTEIAPISMRGEIGALHQFASTVGILVGYSVGAAFSEVPGTWRWMMGIPVLFCLFHLVAGLLVPIESPKWLLWQGRHEEAVEMLRKLRPYNVDFEYSSLQAEIAAKEHYSLSFALSHLRFKELFISVGLMFFQQATGIFAVMCYLSSFLQMAGFSLIVSNYASVVVGVLDVFVSMFDIILLDRFGRRPLLLSGLTAMFVSLIGIAVAFLWQSYLSPVTLGVISLICTLIFITCFSFSFESIPIILISELCASPTRAFSMGIASAVAWLTNLMLSLSFLSLIEASNAFVVFTGYSGMAIAAFVFVMCFVPETSGNVNKPRI